MLKKYGFNLFVVPLFFLVYSLVRLFFRGNEFLVLVHSFDGYERFWAIMSFYLEKYLPPEIPVRYVSETKSWASSRYPTITTGHGSFVYRLCIALWRVRKNTKYVLYLQEDMWLSSYISHGVISEWVESAENSDFHILKIGANSIVHSDRSYADFSITSWKNIARPREFSFYKSDLFAMSHHPSIFRADFLFTSAILSLLFNRRSPYEHECFFSEVMRNHLYRTDGGGGYFRVGSVVGLADFPYIHASKGGVLYPQAVEAIVRDGLLFSERL